MTPKPLPDSFGVLEEVFQHYLRNVQYSAPMTAFNFAGTYVGRRRTNYEIAAQSLLHTPLSPKDATIRAFIKAEKYNFTAKSNPAPRIIQPRDPRYIVESGRYIKPIEKKIYKIMDALYESKVIFKGLNSERRGQALRSHWDHFKNPVAVGADASRFDQTVSKPALLWEHSIYKLFYPHDKYFHQILRWQLENRGVARCSEGTVKYKTDGCRMSGDSNTALGNCLLMCAMMYAYARSIGVEIRMANDGDDCVVVMDQCNLETFGNGLHEYFSLLGFNMAIEEPVYVFEHIEFCQCHPVYDGEQYIMVRDPRVAISKDTVAIKPLDNNKILKRWSAAVGEGGMHLTGGIPIWQDFYSVFIRIGSGARPLKDPTLETGMQRMARGMYRKYKPISSATRYSFFLAFGISPQEQYVTEEYYHMLDFEPDGQSTRFVTLPIPGREDDACLQC